MKFDRSTLATTEAQLKTTRLRADADGQLFTQGLVSSLQLQQSQSAEQEYETRYELERERLQMATDTVEAQLAVEQAEVDRLRTLYELRQQQVADLHVRAGMPGVLQQVPLEEGQRVATGTLLSILGLLDSPTTGDYTLNGRPVAQLSQADRAWMRNREVGFIFQSFFEVGDPRIVCEAIATGPTILLTSDMKTIDRVEVNRWTVDNAARFGLEARPVVFDVDATLVGWSEDRRGHEQSVARRAAGYVAGRRRDAGTRHRRRGAQERPGDGRGGLRPKSIRLRLPRTRGDRPVAEGGHAAEASPRRSTRTGARN